MSHCELVNDLGTLRNKIPEWEDLCSNSPDSNPFFEHWYAIPAFEFVEENRPYGILFVYDNQGQLDGLFPLEIKSQYRKQPGRHLGFWNHPHCYLSAPVIRGSKHAVVWEVFFNWWKKSKFSHFLLIFAQEIRKSEVSRTLLKEIDEEHPEFICDKEVYARASYTNECDSDSYLKKNLSSRHYKELGRKKRRLGDQGAIEFCFGPVADPNSTQINDFLALEHLSWKGREGTSILSRPNETRFFEAVTRSAIERNRLSMNELRVDGKLVAGGIMLHCPPGVYFIKIAFDEDYARFSPGLILGVEHLHWLDEHPEVKWIDSCASPNSPLGQRLWMDRRGLVNTAIARKVSLAGLGLVAGKQLRAIRSRMRAD